MAETRRVEATPIRLVWALLTLLFPGTGIILYLAAWFILPIKPALNGEADRLAPLSTAGRRRLGQLLGWLAIGVGAFYLADYFTAGWLGEFMREFRRYLWPIVLIALGGALLLHRGSSGEWRRRNGG